MKRILFLIAVLLLALSLVSGCSKPATEGNSGGNDVFELKVGATPIPHAEILEFVKPILEEKGLRIRIVEFTDYVTPNLALSDGEIDANYFQHIPYMNTFAANNNLDLVAVTSVHVEPLGLYSKKLSSIEDLKEGSKVAIPNDPTNMGRALILFEKNGLIELRKDVDPLKATEKDIVNNPKKLRFIPLEAPQLPRSLDDVDAAIINTNYALEAKLNPVEDSLIIEDKDSPYANVLTVRPENKDDENIKLLAEILNSPEVKAFIEEKYKGAVVPAF